MKTTLIILIVLFMLGLSIPGLHAQAKQRKVLLLQIAALQTYIGYAKKGYTVVKNGLHFIGNVKKGELNEHSDYFSSLLKVNPKVRNYIKVGKIVSLQLKIRKSYLNTMIQVQQDDLFHGDELDHIERTFEKLFKNCNSTLDVLMMIITDASLEMKDDQRIERIDGLYQTMLDDYLFCKNFSGEIKLLSLSKLKEENDSKQGQELIGL